MKNLPSELDRIFPELPPSFDRRRRDRIALAIPLRILSYGYLEENAMLGSAPTSAREACPSTARESSPWEKLSFLNFSRKASLPTAAMRVSPTGLDADMAPISLPASDSCASVNHSRARAVDDVEH